MNKRLISVNTHEAKSKLSALLKAVEEEDLVVHLCRNGKPVAELRRLTKSSKDPLVQHDELSKVIFSEDASLPAKAEDWPEEER
jgi:prevent-host-death family protein